MKICLKSLLIHNKWYILWGLFWIILGIIIASSLIGCNPEQIKSINETISPNTELDVNVYAIRLPTFDGREAIYCKNYTKDGDDLIITEWWKDNGGTVWYPTKHIGTLRISGTYTIENFIVSSLPKE